MLVWLRAASPGVGKLLHSTMTLHCKSNLLYLSVLDTVSIACSILVQRNGLSFCSGVGFIIEVLAGGMGRIYVGMGRIYVLNSPAVPGALGSAAEVRWCSPARRRPGTVPRHQGVGCFDGRQSCAILRAVLSCRPSAWRQVSEGSWCWEGAGLC